MNLEINEFSWNNNTNLLYVDNPIGTGYSKSGPNDYVINEEEVAS